jgi:hypothetical protein
VEYEISLLPDSSLPNIGLYKQSIMEVDEVKKQLHQLLEQGVIQPRTSTCGPPIIIELKNNGTIYIYIYIYIYILVNRFCRSVFFSVFVI